MNISQQHAKVLHSALKGLVSAIERPAVINPDSSLFFSEALQDARDVLSAIQTLESKQNASTANPEPIPRQWRRMLDHEKPQWGDEVAFEGKEDWEIIDRPPIISVAEINGNKSIVKLIYRTRRPLPSNE